MVEAVRRLVERFSAYCEGLVAGPPCASPQVRDVQQRLGAIDWNARSDRPRSTGPVPALSALPWAIAAAERAGVASLSDDLLAALGFAHWETFYARTPWSEPFFDFLATGEFVGPKGRVPSNNVAFGIMLLGPHMTYAEHAHAAAELYFVVGGSADWFIDRPDQLYTCAAGEALVLDPHRRHAIRTGAEPLLALWCWTGPVDARSYFRLPGPWGEGDIVYTDPAL